jgi:hypothetical protein
MIIVTIEPIQLVANLITPLVIRLANTERAPCTHVVFRFKLPAQIVLLEGSDRIEVPRVDANQTIVHTVRVRPKQVGSAVVVSSNFSYRDALGRSQYPDTFRQEVNVVSPIPQPDLPKPAVSLEMDTVELPLKEWERLRGRLRNSGGATLRAGRLRAVGPITCDPRNPWYPIDILHAGEEVEFSIPVRADERGAKVPVHLEVSYSDDSGKVWHYSQSNPVRVATVPSTSGNQPQGSSQLTVLFLSADPTDASRLRLGVEFREIQERLQLAKLREQFILSLPYLSVRATDISQALLDVQPNIVHFSGHGSSAGALSFEDAVGRTHPIEPDALAALFEQFAKSVTCVLLNCCYSDVQAVSIAKNIDYVIGMKQEIADRAAIAFTIGFYQGLGAGRTVEEAFNLGCVQIRLQGIPDHLTPILRKRSSG